jgi:DNA-binding CsgD family transcriptional regulator
MVVGQAAGKGAGSMVGAGSSEGRLSVRSLVDGAPVAAVATSASNLVSACNRLAVELLGKPAPELIGRDLQEILQAKDIFGNRLDPSLGAFHDMVRRFESLQSFKMDVIGAARAYVRVAVSIVVVLGPGPDEYHLVYLMSQVHRRRRADQVIDQILAGAGFPAAGAYVGENARGATDAYQLTLRQKEVMRLLVEGRKASEISAELNVSVSTVRSHIQSILRALEVSSQLEAVTKALALRLV